MQRLIAAVGTLIILGLPAAAEGASPAPVVLYSQQIQTPVSAGRTWSVLALYRKWGTGRRQLITTVGRIGDYPLSVKLSPNTFVLAVNFEHRVAIQNQWTQAHETVYRTTGTITGSIWTTSSHQLFVWVESSNHRSAYLVDTQTKLATLVYRDTGSVSLKPMAWRQDGYVVLEQTKTTGVQLWSLRLKTRALKSTDITAVSPVYSPDGKIVVVEDEHIADPCSTGGRATNKFEFKDTVTGQEHGYIGGVATATTPLAYSADNQESLFLSTAVATNRTNCVSSPNRHLIHATRASTDTTVVSAADAALLLQQWQAPSIGAWLNHSAGRYRITTIDRTVADVSQPLSIIAQYWQ